MREGSERKVRGKCEGREREMKEMEETERERRAGVEPTIPDSYVKCVRQCDRG
jgi:hypothetical protein